MYIPLREGGVDVEINQFYEDLRAVVDSTKQEEQIILLGDFNARMGKNNIGYEEIMGKYGEEVQANRNGKSY